MKRTCCKLLSCLLALAVILVFSAGCRPRDEGSEAIRVGGLKGPTSMGMVKLMCDADGGKYDEHYRFFIAAAADELTPLLLRGELDVLSLPANLAAVLWARTGGGIRVAAVNTLGVQYIVEKGGETVRAWADLRGKTLLATGQGTVNEYNLRYLLTQGGLDPDTDVTVVWKSEPTEVVAALKVAETCIALLPQPAVTNAKRAVEGLRVALSLDEEWNRLDNGSRLVTGVTVVRAAWADAHPEELALFLARLRDSIGYVNDHPEEMSEAVAHYIDTVTAPVAAQALPECHLAYMDGEEMKDTLSRYLRILWDQDPASVGGQMPGDDFYCTVGAKSAK